MSSEDRPNTLLEDLESRQDDAIAQLDELNLRIENLLRQWTHQRETDAALEGPAASV
jgi:hypothetical protein